MSFPPAWDDLDPFVDPDDFGVRAVVSFQAGGTRSINVLFDDPAAGIKYAQRNPMAPPTQLGDYDMDAELPRMTAKENDLAGVKRRDSVRIGVDKDGNGGTEYGILSGAKPDGNGFATVSLTLEP